VQKLELSKVEFIHGLNVHRDRLLDNIKANCALGLPEFKTRKALLVAGGPSAGDHVENIRRDVAAGWELWTVNGAHDWIISHGMTPNYCTMMDGFDVSGKFIQNPHPDCTYYAASQAYPGLVRRIRDQGANVVLWHAALDAEAHALMGEGATITAHANTVGLHSLQMMCLVGVRQARLYGMDSSHRPNADHAYDNSHQIPAEELEFYYQDVPYRSTGTFAAQAVMFHKMYPKFFHAGLRIEVVGDGLLPAMWRNARDVLYAELLDQKQQADTKDPL
jgi:hypothetical protein